MNQGAKQSDFLAKVTVHERKEFWKNLLKKAKPANEANLRSAKRKLEDADGNQNYNNGNYNQDADGQNQYQNQYQDGNYNYGGNNDVNYNYNGYNNGNYNGDNQYDDDSYPGVDWTNLGFDMQSYSLKYTGCSAVKTYDSDKAASDDYDTVLSTKRFALFRLCPTDSCNKYSVNGCGRNYGEYVLEMDAFLEGVVEFNRQRYWHYCHFCRRCNALESYGSTMSQVSEQQMEYYEQMQADAEAYYEEQQAKYQEENEQYGNENAANYQYYGNYGQNNQNYNNQNNQNYNNAQYGEDDAEAEGEEDGNRRKLANNNNNGNGGSSYSYRQYYRQNNGNQNAQSYQQNVDDDVNYDNENQYNNFVWNDDFGDWDDDWSESWLAFNWQALPYCSSSELEACSNADEVCSDYDDDFQEDADAMGGFSACTQIDDQYYIGPHCNNDGYTITLGVYSDQYCDNFVGDEVSLYDVLGYDIDEEFDFFPQDCVSCEEGVSIFT
jgi:hypothetical protein